MKINYNRLLILLLAMLSLSTLMLAANVRKVDFAANGNQATLSNNTDYGFDLQFKLQDFSLEEINTKAGAFDQLSIEGFGFSNQIGSPKLPVYSKLIAVPIGAKVEFEFVTKNQLTINKTDAKLLNRIIPAQASVSKSANPDFLPFEIKNDIYARNEMSNNTLFKVEEIGYMRGVRMFKFDYEPIQYNPSTGEIKVCDDAYIKVNFVGADMAATKDLIDRTASYEYDNLYAKSFMNWKAPDRASLVRYPTKILILCPAAYTTTLEPFVTWKKQQGYNVVVTTVGTGGTVTNTTAAIKTYMTNVYAAGTTQDPAPTYLIIVEIGRA
ncbi:MAG: C25 family peptidase propeptide domain-containing protein, partial [Candidatus Cloacimonas sp.]|nr:C25 family peptidase propeptide domain-containing protein [Candidatus Cloacimonas sp.]